MWVRFTHLSEDETDEPRYYERLLGNGSRQWWAIDNRDTELGCPWKSRTTMPGFESYPDDSGWIPCDPHERAAELYAMLGYPVCVECERSGRFHFSGVSWKRPTWKPGKQQDCERCAYGYLLPGVVA